MLNYTVNVCKKLWVQVNNEPKLVGRSNEGKVPTVLWNEQMQTDATIRNNKPVIVIRVDKKGTCVLIEVVISGGRNAMKEAEKILKYKYLQ